jgi:hypothetical protein
MPAIGVHVYWLYGRALPVAYLPETATAGVMRRAGPCFMEASIRAFLLAGRRRNYGCGYTGGVPAAG